MPMLDAFIPEGALPATAEKDLLAKLTNILLLHEGADPADPRARSIAWVLLHRPAAVFVAGEPAEEPRYRFIASVPQGQLDRERRQAVVKAITDAVLDAEHGAYPRDPLRVWVFANEIPDGTWGGGGRIFTLADITGFVMGDPRRGAPTPINDSPVVATQSLTPCGHWVRARHPRRLITAGIARTSSRPPEAVIRA